MMHSSITRTIYHNSNVNLGPSLLNNDCSKINFKQEVVGVTLTRLELALVLTMYISAVVILVVVFEVLKPSISAHLMGSN
uniref:Col_cuticle_N domain-containing protein n=1 Tax=Caenorhabditis tropicalis TaxID=1561998 RepID=A0A1I7V4H7_9PELO